MDYLNIFLEKFAFQPLFLLLFLFLVIIFWVVRGRILSKKYFKNDKMMELLLFFCNEDQVMAEKSILSVSLHYTANFLFKGHPVEITVNCSNADFQYTPTDIFDRLNNVVCLLTFEPGSWDTTPHFIMRIMHKPLPNGSKIFRNIFVKNDVLIIRNNEIKYRIKRPKSLIQLMNRVSQQPAEASRLLDLIFKLSGLVTKTGNSIVSANEE